MLQDRVNMLLTVGHAAVLGACGQGARVHQLPEKAPESQVGCLYNTPLFASSSCLHIPGIDFDKYRSSIQNPACSGLQCSICLFTHIECTQDRGSEAQLTHMQLNALLGVLKHHITSFWPCKRRSNLDARILKRLTGQDKFVDFESSDPAARGMLIRGLHDMFTILQHRYKELLCTSTATTDSTWNKWVIQERDMTWRALALASRARHTWGAILTSQLHGLLVERTPGTSLMMLKAVRFWYCKVPRTIANDSECLSADVPCLQIL